MMVFYWASVFLASCLGFTLMPVNTSAEMEPLYFFAF